MRYRKLYGTAIGALAVIFAGCSESNFNPGFEDDSFAPSVAIIKTGGDTVKIADGIEFGVSAADNLGLRSVSVALSGGFTAIVDTVFTGAVTDVALTYRFDLPPNTTAGGNIEIAATAIDGADLIGTDLDSVFLINEDAILVSLNKPNPGALASPGLSLPIEVVASHKDGISEIGYLVTGVFSDSVSISNTVPLPGTAMFVDTLQVPAGTSEGTFTITGFATDAKGRFAFGTPVTVTVQSISNDQTAPIVTFEVNDRVELDDSISVSATDPSGVTRIGWLVRNLGGAVVGGDSTNLTGTLTDVSDSWELALDPTLVGQSLIVEAFGVDGAGNRGTATTPSGGLVASGAALLAAAQDTILVVSGITVPLPAGGLVKDGIYSRGQNEIYFTNIELNRLEVFDVATSTFSSTGIATGSQPHGIALWPRDATGTAGDTVVVANSGGTDLTIIDLISRREVRRHALPNFLVDEVTTELDPATLVVQLKFTRHDFSDRPQFLGMTCRPGVGACNANDILAVYSTTPTIDQDGLPERGSVRWENLTDPTPTENSHFFWEHAQVLPAPQFDTLRVFVDRGPGTGLEEILSPACGRMVDVEQLVFRDTTFVRNSGDFSHALVGEGGVVFGEAFARGVGFDSRDGTATQVCTGSIMVADAVVAFTGPEIVDLGITPSFRVSDFISNTATIVNSIAVNFNGLTNLIRTTDTTYVLNEGLRLKGLIAEEGANPGMDLVFNHDFEAGIGGTPGTFGGTGNPNDRLVFLASSNPEVEVYDTFFFANVGTIPIRDPIIGPMRVAEEPGGNVLIVGATATGIVVVEIPPVTNPFPVVATPPQR